MMMKGNKAIIVAAVVGFMAGNMVSVPKADDGGILGNSTPVSLYSCPGNRCKRQH